MLLRWGFMAFQHILGHYGHGPTKECGWIGARTSDP